MKIEKHYLVYQITNLINQKIYIGIHVTSDINDGYMGSGKYISNAINKHGVENFEKDILFDFDNPEEMIAKESELVDRDFIARKDVYNIACGGRVPATWDTCVVKDYVGNVFRVRCDDLRLISGELKHITHNMVVVKDKLGNFLKVSTDDPRYVSGELVVIWKGRKHSSETKRLIGELHKNRLKLGTSIHSSIGTCWIYNLDLKENKKIKKEDFHIWLDSGWIKGRKMTF